MITAIIIDDTGSSNTALEKALMLQGIPSVAESVVVSIDPMPLNCNAGQWIQAESLVSGLRQAATQCATKRVLVMSGCLDLDVSWATAFTAEALARPSMEHLYAPFRVGGETVELADITPSRIVQSLSSQQVWPLLCVATNRSSLSAHSYDSTTTAVEFILLSLIRATADGDIVSRSMQAEVNLSTGMIRALCELDYSALARALSAAIDSMNIEELFPDLSWTEHSQESAAAVYHSLAALFIRFGDIESANQCLAHSERLEESPRLFALKGLIQHTRGETLGAVANLVSSLQCYETRKVADGKHYLSFKPKNLEVIASRLVDGLNALNRQDNDKALTHFSEAIFNFDSFYSEYGVHSLEKIRQ